MQALQIFNYEDAQVRTVIVAGEPWFVARDVAEVLGYKDTINAIKAHCKGVAKHHLPSQGGTQEYSIIPERDVYRLIMRSKLPSAERFEEWVVGEVLPAIRKTGRYNANLPAIPQTFSEALQLAADQAKRLDEQEGQIRVMQPKAAVADRIASADGLYGFREVAKILNVNERKFKKWLIANSWVYASGKLKAMADKIRAGYLEHKTKLIEMSNGEDKSVSEMFFTPKGLARLTAIFNAHPNLDFSFAR